DTAARLLFERQDKTAIPSLEKLVNESKSPLARMHALYVLDGLDALSEKTVLPRLQDGHPGVRRHAVRLAEKLAVSWPAIRQRLLAMVDYSDLPVRYQLAFSLGELPNSAERNAALVKLTKRDVSDGYVRVAVLSSLAEGAGEVLQQLAGDSQFV